MFLHIFFVIVHLICLFFFFVGLLVSIPLHIITTMMRGSRKKMEQQTELLKEQNELLKKQVGEEKTETTENTKTRTKKSSKKKEPKI
jgi:hypothetical protein